MTQIRRRHSHPRVVHRAKLRPQPVVAELKRVAPGISFNEALKILDVNLDGKINRRYIVAITDTDQNSSEIRKDSGELYNAEKNSSEIRACTEKPKPIGSKEALMRGNVLWNGNLISFESRGCDEIGNYLKKIAGSEKNTGPDFITIAQKELLQRKIEGDLKILVTDEEFTTLFKYNSLFPGAVSIAALSSLLAMKIKGAEGDIERGDWRFSSQK